MPYITGETRRPEPGAQTVPSLFGTSFVASGSSDLASGVSAPDVIPFTSVDVPRWCSSLPRTSRVLRLLCWRSVLQIPTSVEDKRDVERALNHRDPWLARPRVQRERVAQRQVIAVRSFKIIVMKRILTGASLHVGAPDAADGGARPIISPVNSPVPSAPWRAAPDLDDDGDADICASAVLG